MKASAMGDSRRFDLFAGVIHNNFPGHRRVADVAGGKGMLQRALRERGYEVTTFDKRSGHRSRLGRYQYQYRYFDGAVSDEFDLLVGMHPDEATDVIIVEASRRGVPFVVCPCCVKPYAVAYWGRHKYNDWMRHLRKIAEIRGFVVTETKLPMNGKNIVLIGRPKKGRS